MVQLFAPKELLVIQDQQIHHRMCVHHTLVELMFPKQELLPKGMPSQQNMKELSSKEIDRQLKHYLQATENKLLKVKIKAVKKYFY